MQRQQRHECRFRRASPCSGTSAIHRPPSSCSVSMLSFIGTPWKGPVCGTLAALPLDWNRADWTARDRVTSWPPDDLSPTAWRASAKWPRLGAGFGITAIATMRRPLSRHAASSTVCHVLPDRGTANASSVPRPRPEADFRGSASQSKPAPGTFLLAHQSWRSRRSDRYSTACLRVDSAAASLPIRRLMREHRRPVANVHLPSAVSV